MRLAAALALLLSVPLMGAQPASAHPGPVPVIYDSDMDFDDASTLAYLCAEHKLGRIDLRAVTVANDGFGVPDRTLRHAHTILRQCGLPDVPIAAGATGEGTHPAPAELVTTIEKVLSGALGDGSLPAFKSSTTAVELIRRTADRSVTIIATGPLTNLADALGRGVRVGRIQIMGGALRVPGNLYGSALPGYDNSQEFNMWMDPASARKVLWTARPGTVRLVPLDATAAVPITQDYIARLGADQHAPGARIAYRIATQPDLAALIDLNIMYWWDALAAVSAVHDDGSIATFHPVRVDVLTAEGAQSGRTVMTAGGARVFAASEANRETFEQRFLDSLNERAQLKVVR